MSRPPDRPQYAPNLPLFGGPRLKVLRAETHLADFEQRIVTYLNTRPYRVVEDLYGKPGTYELRIKVLDWPPHEWGPIMGDVLGNLRAALDHMVYDLTLAFSGEPLKRTGFPILMDPGIWDESSKKKGQLTERSGLYKTRGINPKAQAIIEKAQPYNSGEEPTRVPLAMLNELVNFDKHRTLTLTAAAINNAVLWKPPGVETFVTGPGPFIDGMTLATVTGWGGKDKPNVQLDLAFDVAFDYWTPYNGSPVLPNLKAMRDAVIHMMAVLTHFTWK